MNTFNHHYSAKMPGSVVLDSETTRAASIQIRQARLRLQKFLSTLGERRKTVALSNKPAAFTQGDPADEVFYNREGKIRLTVVKKEATLGILSQGDFFGEGLNVSAHNHDTMGYIPPTLTALPRNARSSPTAAVLNVVLLQGGIHSRGSKGLRIRE